MTADTQNNMFNIVASALSHIDRADTAEIGFSNFMAERGGFSKEAYLHVRKAIKDVIAYYATEQKESKALERQLKKEGPHTGPRRSESHANRLYLRGRITEDIALRHAGKAWSSLARLGDPMLMSRREDLIAQSTQTLSDMERERADIVKEMTQTAVTQKARAEQSRKAFEVYQQARQASDTISRHLSGLQANQTKLTRSLDILTKKRDREILDMTRAKALLQTEASEVSAPF